MQSSTLLTVMLTTQNQVVLRYVQKCKPTETCLHSVCAYTCLFEPHTAHRPEVVDLMQVDPRQSARRRSAPAQLPGRCSDGPHDRQL